MPNTPNTTDSDDNCQCYPAHIHWKPNDGWSDEHQYIIPGTCSQCGSDVQFVYTEAGIKDTETREYLHEF